MAKKQQFTAEGSVTEVERRKVKHIWGIDEAVSWFRYCSYDDVLLIQYLLNRSGYLSWTEELDQDGLFGRKTYGAIRKFQRESHYNYCLVDGAVDTYKGRTWSTKSNTIYTIILLNDALLVKCPTYFKDISRDPNCPTELTYLAGGAPVS